MDARWQTRTETDNQGKPLQVWFCDEYEISRNVNLGDEGGWVFELTLAGRRVGLFGSVTEGKECVRAREQEDCKPVGPTGGSENEEVAAL